MRFIEMMARTPGGSWPGCRPFGIRNLLESMKVRPEGLKQAEQAINDALKDLGITHYRLESMRRESAPGADADVYSLTIVSSADPDRKFTTTVARQE
ncbi:MAG: hypothetical protein HZB13_02510 [Acidobacteria bacterium]|nr:hypothetical protein [Acidobacteriota bacterium]